MFIIKQLELTLATTDYEHKRVERTSARNLPEAHMLPKDPFESNLRFSQLVTPASYEAVSLARITFCRRTANLRSTPEHVGSGVISRGGNALGALPWF